MIFKLCMDDQGLKVFKIYINDDPELTMTCFTSKSHLVKIAYCGRCHVSVYSTIGPLVFRGLRAILLFGFECKSLTIVSISRGFKIRVATLFRVMTLMFTELVDNYLYNPGFVLFLISF